MRNSIITKCLNKFSPLLVLIMFAVGNGFAQNIAINTTGELADPSALIDISATNKGFLMPRVALTGLTDNTTITSPDNALLVYNTATTGAIWPGFYYWNSTGGIWERVAAGYGGGFSWNTLGNRGTSASANFIGTTDNFDFYIRMNNINRLVLESNRLRFLNSGNSIFMGEAAGSNDDLSDHYNVGIGYYAMNTPTGANYSVAIGREALRYVNAAGVSAVAIGQNALKNLTSGTNNVAVGYSALGSTTTGSFNTSVGVNMSSTTTGNNNTGFVGMVGSTYNHNTVLGGLVNPKGDYNIGVGHQAFNTSGTQDRSIGIGFNALKSVAASTDNIAIGEAALNDNGNAIKGFNVGIGARSGGNSTKEGGVHIGYGAGYSAAADNLLYIDNSTSATPLIYGNFTTNRVGINRVATANSFEVGGTASKATAAAWLANSDRRIKTKITDIENALATIQKLRPVTFKYTEEWKEKNAYIKENDYTYYNYIAQEYQKVFPESVKGSGEYLDGDKKEILQIDTYNAQIVLIKAIQEQQRMLDQLQKEIESYEIMKKENKAMAEVINSKLSEIEKVRDSIMQKKISLTAQTK